MTLTPGNENAALWPVEPRTHGLRRGRDLDPRVLTSRLFPREMTGKLRGGGQRSSVGTETCLSALMMQFACECPSPPPPSCRAGRTPTLRLSLLHGRRREEARQVGLDGPDSLLLAQQWSVVILTCLPPPHAERGATLGVGGYTVELQVPGRPRLKGLVAH